MVEEYGTRVNPRFGTKTFRNGIDIDAVEGSNVHVVYPGHVLYTGWFRGYGNLIIVDHGSEYYTLYAHVADMKVAEGDDVRAGTGDRHGRGHGLAAGAASLLRGAVPGQAPGPGPMAQAPRVGRETEDPRRPRWARFGT